VSIRDKSSEATMRYEEISSHAQRTTMFAQHSFFSVTLSRLRLDVDQKRENRKILF